MLKRTAKSNGEQSPVPSPQEILDALARKVGCERCTIKHPGGDMDFEGGDIERWLLVFVDKGAAMHRKLVCMADDESWWNLCLSDEELGYPTDRCEALDRFFEKLISLKSNHGLQVGCFGVMKAGEFCKLLEPRPSIEELCISLSLEGYLDLDRKPKT